MRNIPRTLIAITMIGTLPGSSALAVVAGNIQYKPFAGVAVKDIVMLEQFPHEVQSGSVRIKEGNKQTMAAHTGISLVKAAKIAAMALHDKVVHGQLGEENGYLIWEVTLVSSGGRETQLKIDAGNGYLLAVETSHSDQYKGEREDREEDNPVLGNSGNTVAN